MECLANRMLPYLPTALEVLMHVSADCQDMCDVVALLNQLMLRYKTLLQDLLQEVQLSCSRVSAFLSIHCITLYVSDCSSPPVCVSACLCLSVCLSVLPSVCLSVCQLPACLFVRPSDLLSVHLFVHLSVCLSAPACLAYTCLALHYHMHCLPVASPSFWPLKHMMQTDPEQNHRPDWW